MALRKRPRRGGASQWENENEDEGKGDDEVVTVAEEVEVEEEISTSPYFDRKKKPESVASRRAASHARVAHSRAAHFARLPVSSSCPTGVVASDRDKDMVGEKNTPEKESWPGPFSTANDMIKKRDSVKRAREAALALAEKDSTSRKGSSNIAFGDVYDQLLQAIATDLSSRSHSQGTLPMSIFIPQTHIPRLSALAVTTLATWWDHVEELGNLSTTSLAALGSELSRQRKLSSHAVRLMFPTTVTSHTDKGMSTGDYGAAELDFSLELRMSAPVHRTVLLSDCSALDEECIFDLIMGTSSHMESLELKNVGHSFTSQLVDRLVAAASSSSTTPLLSLEVLSLTGMYRLQDVYLTKFFSHLLMPNRLHTLNLSKNSCLAHDGVMTLLQCGLFTQLTTLILDCTLIHGAAMAVVKSGEDEGEDEEGIAAGLREERGQTGDAKLYEENAITLLCRGHHEAFPLLSSLSLGGVASMSDSDVSLLLTPSDELRRRQSKSCSSSAPTYLEVGARLQALNLRECPLLTDKSLIVIRARCRSLRHLDLSHLPLLTTPALMSLFMQEKYVAPVESLTSATLSSGILPPTALNRSIGPLRHLALEGLGKSVTDDVVIEACVLSSNAGSGLSDINLSGCSSVTDKSLAALTHHCAHTLERVDFSFLRHITLPVFLHLLGMCVARGIEMEVTVWGCSQLRRAVMETMEQQQQDHSCAEREVESGNVLDLLRQMRRNSSKAVSNVNFTEIDDTIKFPKIIGFLEV